MKNSEAPGATNRSNPKRATTIPSTKISHQGRVSPLLPAYVLILHLPRRLSTPRPHYCPCHLRHRDHLGESTLRTRIHRSGGHFVLQARRQDKRRDAAPRCTVVELTHEVQPIPVWQPHVDQRGVQPSLP